MKKIACAEIMTPDPVRCLPSDTAYWAAYLMKTKDIGPIPVVQTEEDNLLIGIVTDRDLALKVVGEARDPRCTRIADVMTRDPVTCRRADTVEEVLRAMSDNHVRRIPVVDRRDRLIGMIAQADVATRLAEPAKTAGLVREISKSKEAA
jgi:CBS domain-containing protein